MTAPFQAIPDSTQVHVDRLIGAQVGGYEVVARAGEGRLGTIYRAQQVQGGRLVTLEVLRTEVRGDDEGARAANAIKSPGIALVTAFGELPDGRRYRVMELLEGESLDQLVQRTARLSPQETVKVLDQLALVLEAAHAWAIVHGCLGPSSVFLHAGALKVIDFGLARTKVTPQDDLKALGALGFTLLTGEEPRDGKLPSPSPSIPEALYEVLGQLMDEREPDATSTRRSLAHASLSLEVPPALAQEPAATPPKGRRAGVIAALAALVLAAAAGGAFVFWPAPASPEPEPVVVTPEQTEAEIAALDEPQETPPEEPDKPGEPARPVRPPKAPRAVPSAQALYEQTSRLEAQLRKQARPGDDVEQALFVLNKQRLRLTGSPTLEDRKEVARQLAGWKRSYLRP